VWRERQLAYEPYVVRITAQAPEDLIRAAFCQSSEVVECYRNARRDGVGQHWFSCCKRPALLSYPVNEGSTFL
jgi:hypothetical protein